MKILFFQPHATLRKYIECYWCWESVSEGAYVSLPRILSSTNSELIFLYGSSLDMIKNGIQAKLPNSFVVSPQQTYIDIKATSPYIGVFGVRFLPGEFRNFCSHSLTDFLNSFPTCEMIWGMRGIEVEECIISATSLQDKIKTIEQFLITNLLLYERDDFFSKTNTFKLLANSSFRVNEIAQSLFVSPRHFQRVIKNEIGMSPKFFQQISRFEKTTTSILLRNIKDYKDTIFFEGYFDQSHFIKDFNRFAGCPPQVILTLDSYLSYFYNENGNSFTIL